MDVVDFAKGFASFHKDARIIIDFLSSKCRDETFYGSMTDLARACGIEVNYIVVDGICKREKDLLSQFRRLGILELSKSNIMSYNKTKGGYVFSLNKNWFEIIKLKGRE